MKKLPYLLATLLSAGQTNATLAQTAPKAAHTQAATKSSHQDCCMMKDGKMTMMKGGKMTPMTADMTMADGTVCMTNGTCQMMDGTTMKMKGGQCMMMNGKMKMPAGAKGHHKMDGMKM